MNSQVFTGDSLVHGLQLLKYLLLMSKSKTLLWSTWKLIILKNYGYLPNKLGNWPTQQDARWTAWESGWGEFLETGWPRLFLWQVPRVRSDLDLFTWTSTREVTSWMCANCSRRSLPENRLITTYYNLALKKEQSFTNLLCSLFILLRSPGFEHLQGFISGHCRNVDKLFVDVGGIITESF